jgi:hypothetical protein
VTDPTARWVDPNPPGQDDTRTTAILATAGVLLTVVVVVTLVAVVLTATSRGSRGEVLVLIAANAPSDEAFTRSILVAPVTISAQARERSAALLQQSPVRADRGVRLVSGLQPQLYGATGPTPPCDVVTLANMLDSNAGVGRTWGLALGLTPEQIPYYLNTLTPVILTVDTWVTAHMLGEESAYAKQAVLQAGNAVLVDPQGVPRTLCATGGPLTPPANTHLGDYRITGEEWADFATENVVATQYSYVGRNTPAEEFALIDVFSGEPTTRRVAGAIDLGGATVPLPDPAVMNVPPPTEPTGQGMTVAPPGGPVPSRPPAFGEPPADVTAPPPASPHEPIRVCGPVPSSPHLVLVDYDVDAISCPDAFDVIERFLQRREKYATVDDWNCGALGAAEAERRGHVINCRGPRGELRVESP